MIFPGAETQRENEITENTHYYQMDNSSDQTYFVQNETLYATYKEVIWYEEKQFKALGIGSDAFGLPCGIPADPGIYAVQLS